MEDMGQAGVTFITIAEESELVATAGYKPWKSVWKTAVKAVTEQDRQKMEQQAYRYVHIELRKPFGLCSLSESSCLFTCPSIAQSIATSTR